MKPDIVDVDYEEVGSIDWTVVRLYALHFFMLILPVIGTLLVIANALYYHKLRDYRKRRVALVSIAVFYTAGLLTLIAAIALQ